MLYKRLIWLIRKHPYTPALIYFKKIFHFLTFQTSKLPKTVAKRTKNMTSFPCSVRPEKFHPYIHRDKILFVRCTIGITLFLRCTRQAKNHFAEQPLSLTLMSSLLLIVLIGKTLWSSTSIMSSFL